MSNQRSRRSSSGWLSRLVGLGMLGGWACSAVVDLPQCRDNADCLDERGGDFVCDASRCVLRPDPSEVACESSEDCTAVFEEGHVCNPTGRCAALASSSCSIVRPPADTDPDHIVWVGSILATSPPYDALVLPLQNAVQLAIEDFNGSTSLAGGKKIGWVGCDSRGSVDGALDAARHLVHDVGVPAIVGPTFSESTMAVANEVTIASRVFLMTPTATHPAISDLDDGGLVWRTITSDVHQAEAIADRLPLLDPAPSRVLLLGKDDAYGRGLVSDVNSLVSARLPGVALATLIYEDPARFASNEALLSSYGSIIGTGYQHRADTVVVAGTSEARELILFYLQAWSNDPDAPSLPRFLVSHGGVPVLESIVNSVAEGPFRPALMERLEGTSPVIADPENFSAYNIRYMIRFDDQEAITSSSLSYDATMVTLLAMLAADAQKSLDGVEIARAMPRLVEGTRVSFGETAFPSQAREILVEGGSIDLLGISGELDFDLLTGDVRTDLIGWGVVPRPGTTDVPLLSAKRMYLLDDPPAVGGTWIDL
jgi:ABC-type branched-subunit amino acid transport system substrate-binding protein